MHWLTAGLMVIVFVLAFSIDLATSHPAHTALLQLHRSIGLTSFLETRQCAHGDAAGGWMAPTPLSGRLSLRERQSVNLTRHRVARQTMGM
jgi:hypothetical protein